MTLRRAAIGGIAAAVAAVAALYCGLAPPALDRGRDLSALVLARDGSILRGFLTRDGKWRLPADVDRVDPLYRRMLIATEDARFGSHPGVDPLAVLRAASQLVSRGHIVSGASTLTMQTVRLLHRRPRSFAAKLAEMGEALALQRRLPVNDVLELYLTLAPFGGNLEGVRSASLAYFGKEPARLSPAEAALLVAIPRSPERLRPDRHPDSARAARNAVLARLAARGLLSAQEVTEAQSEPVPTIRTAMPFHAPHLARVLHDAEPNSAVQRTMIDPLLQQQVEALLRRETSSVDPQATFAAIVIDNRTRRVLADVGNAVFTDATRRGTLDMTRAVRSPGSALKPFLYAIAFDRLILHPETILEDRRRYFGDYAPSDFDGRFQGEVTARQALQYSLNVPAVDVMQHLGPARFVAALAAAGIRLRLPRRETEAGLAIALGGVGISLADLATLYAALPNAGNVAPLRYRDADPEEPGTALFGPVAAWYVGDILAAAPAPPGVLPAEVRIGRPLAFKTGTSYGFRDVWAVGYDQEVTIAVWAGRPDGTPMPGRSGRLTAAPVLFKIADLLGPAGSTVAHRSAPTGALFVTQRDLPAGLRRLSPGPLDLGGKAEGVAPKILYPPDGSAVAWDGQDIPLEAHGGRGALRWLIDGRPLPPGQPRRTVYWHPFGVGFARVTVIDRDGRSASATVRIVR